MIHFDPIPEPPDFDVDVRQKGIAWMQKHPDAERPPSVAKMRTKGIIRMVQ